MKLHLASFKKNPRIIFALVILLIVTVLSSGCEKVLKSNSIICNLDDYSLYPKFLEQILPSYTIDHSENNAYLMIKNGSIVEVFDTQAFGALQTGVAKYWYPQYLATAVIAIDRDQTNSVFTSWMHCLSSFINFYTIIYYSLVQSIMSLIRSYKADTAMQVIVVIPLYKFIYPLSCFL